MERSYGIFSVKFDRASRVKALRELELVHSIFFHHDHGKIISLFHILTKFLNSGSNDRYKFLCCFIPVLQNEILEWVITDKCGI